MTARLTKSLKILLASVLLLLLTLSIIPLFISLDQFRPQIEGQLTTVLDRDVQLGSLQLRLLPFPKLRISKLHIGSLDKIDADVKQADIYVALLPLLDEMLVIRRIHLEEANLTQEFIEYISSLSDNEPTGKEDKAKDNSNFHLEKISASKVNFKLSDGSKFGPYKLKVALNKDFTLKFAWLARMNDSIRVDITNKNSIYKFYLQARDWQMPVQPAWKFSRLTAVATLIKEGLDVTAVNGQLYDGSIIGTSKINWHPKWRIQGKADVKDLQLEPFLKLLLDAPVIAGGITGKAEYDLIADKPAALGETPRVDADIVIKNGIIYNADLEQATNLIGETKQGGETPFSILSGKLKMQQGTIGIKELQLKSDVLEAEGYIKIAKDNKLTGVIEVGVTKTASLVSVPIKISGTVDAPDLRPTTEAMAGGAVGTAILGPGVGTTIGIKVGTFITDLFGSDEDNKDEKKPPSKPVTFSEGDEEE